MSSLVTIYIPLRRRNGVLCTSVSPVCCEGEHGDFDTEGLTIGNQQEITVLQFPVAHMAS